MEIQIGMKAEDTILVEKEDTAAEVGSGSLLVYGTPCMVALMEGVAAGILTPLLPEGQTSVGTEMNIKHTSATPVGMEVRAEAEITAVEGRMVTFAVKAFDEKGEIGSGTHKRAIIDIERFLAKTYAKL